MTLPITIPYSFATATSSIPLSQLDSNFSAVASSISDIAGLNTRRNRIINGAMQIDQRNNGAAQTITNGYCIDRWIAVSSGASVTGQRVTGPSGYQYAYQFTGTTGVTGTQFIQRIESYNVADLVNQNVTLSFVASNSLSTLMTVDVRIPSSIDNFTSSISIYSLQIALTPTLTTYNVTFNVGANAANGLQIGFFPGAQPSGTWTITGVQLEAGSYATPFERQIYSDTLAQCQRYYEKGTWTSQLYGSNTGWNYTEWMAFLVGKRINPTIVASASSIINYNLIGTADEALNGFVIIKGVLAAGNGGARITWTANSEL